MAFMSQEDSENLLARKQAEIDDLRARLTASEASQYLVAARATQDDPLRERERRALLLIKEMCQAVILLDMQGIILETNQAGLDPDALRRDSRIGHQIWEPSSWSGSCSVQDQIKAMFQGAIATGEFVRKEIEIQTPGNTTERMVIDISFKAIDNGQKECSFVLFEGRDITKRKQAEEEVARKNVELQALYEQVRKLDQLKSMFFAMMNHELRTPLTLILGPTESLLQQASLTQEVRQALEMVTRNARLLLKLVNDLLEISRLEQGKLELHYATCNLSRVVSLLAANFTLAAEKRHIFAPYSRIVSEQTRYIGGTELGLSVVSEIIHLHRGTIWVESIPENGTTFHFSLPLVSLVPDPSLAPI
ncbi:MAG: PAS domain-containing protein [Ktedonobacteraceae bacterium]|nr:PAS domain-containing protein [Ktedonobacteraceae bacterium]